MIYSVHRRTTRSLEELVLYRALAFTKSKTAWLSRNEEISHRQNHATLHRICKYLSRLNGDEFYRTVHGTVL